MAEENGTRNGGCHNSDQRCELERQYYADMRRSCKMAVDKLVDYLQGVEIHRPFPDVEPGFLLSRVPKDPPREGTTMTAILEDVDRCLLPGVTHWNHPHFHAYFPAANSYPAVCADIIGSGIGGIGFTWVTFTSHEAFCDSANAIISNPIKLRLEWPHYVACRCQLRERLSRKIAIAEPACAAPNPASSPCSTELEMIMVDWLAKMLGLPDFFLHGVCGGGGVIGTTCSEQTIITMMAARNRAIAKYTADHPECTKYEAMSKLVCYASSLAHTSVEKAALLNVLHLRLLPTNEKYELTGAALRTAIQEDLAAGRLPFYCVATLGTTSCCSFDRLDELGSVCEEFDVWLHVDAAYAGSSLICPELRHNIRGIEYVSSMAFNPHKWLLTNFDCSVVWYRNYKCVTASFNTDAKYLKNSKLGKIPDYRHWHLSFGRKFRSLKLWFVIRAYGVSGLQAYIRQHVRMAKYFETLIKKDPRFEVIGEVTMGLVCFRVKNDNKLTMRLYERIEQDGRIHVVTSAVRTPSAEEVDFIRLAIVYLFTDEQICQHAFSVIEEMATEVLEK